MDTYSIFLQGWHFEDEGFAPAWQWRGTRAVLLDRLLQPIPLIFSGQNTLCRIGVAGILMGTFY